MIVVEAIKKLGVYSSTNGSGQCTQDDHKEAKQIAIDVLNRQIPRAPIIHGAIGLDCDDRPNCPNCDTPLYCSENENYCMMCGQKLDWN